MADIKEVNGVFGGVELEGTGEVAGNAQAVANGGVEAKAGLPVEVGFWSKFKGFWFQEINWKKEIKVELTPYQQKIENEINEFLHQEITWEKVHDFLFQEISFGKRKNA